MGYSVVEFVWQGAKGKGEVDKGLGKRDCCGRRGLIPALA